MSDSFTDSMADQVSVPLNTDGGSVTDGGTGLPGSSEGSGPTDQPSTTLPDPTPTQNSPSNPPQDSPSSTSSSRSSDPPQQQQPQPTPPSSSRTTNTRFTTSTRSSSASAQTSASQQTSSADNDADNGQQDPSSDQSRSRSAETSALANSVTSVFTTSEEEVMTSSSGTRVILSTTTRSGVLRTTTLPPAQVSGITNPVGNGDDDLQGIAEESDEVKGGLGAGGKAGIGIGILALVVAAIVAAHYLMRHKRHTKSIKFLRRSRASFKIRKDDFDWEDLSGTPSQKVTEKPTEDKSSRFSEVVSNPLPAPAARPQLVAKSAAVRESTTPAWMAELGLGRPHLSASAGAGEQRSRPGYARANTDSTLIGGAQEALQFSLTAPSDTGSAVHQAFDSRPSSANSGNHLHPLFVPSSANFLTPTSAGSSAPGSSEHSPSMDTLTRSFPLPSSVDPLSVASGVRAGYTGQEGSPQAYQVPPKPLASNNPFRASVDAASSRSASYRHSLNASSPTGSSNNPFGLDFVTSEPNLEFDFAAAASAAGGLVPAPIDTKRASMAAAPLKREKMMSGFSYYNPTTPLTPMPPRKGSNASSFYSADHHAEPVVSKHDSQLDPQPWLPLSNGQRASSGTERRSIMWADGMQDQQSTPTQNSSRLSNIYDAYSGRAF